MPDEERSGAKGAVSPSVLIFSERALMRAAMRMVLGDRVIGEAGAHEQAVQIARTVRPEVAVLDLAGTPLAGRKLISTLRALGVNVVGVSSCAAIDVVVSALNAGIQAYLLDQKDVPALVDAVMTIGQTSTPMLDKNLQSAFAAYMLNYAKRREKTGINDLYEEDLDILMLISDGHSNKEIGRRVGLSSRSVEGRIERLCAILAVRNRVEASARAAELGLYRQQANTGRTSINIPDRDRALNRLSS